MMAAAAVVIPLTGGFVLHAMIPKSGFEFPVEAAVGTAVTWSLLLVLLGSSARLESTAAARRRALCDIAMQSRIDPLTKALNRFGMMETLEGAWVESRSSGAQFGLILLDLDYFERLNETFGHDAGDDALARVSATLQRHLRDTDALGRWGGGEFLILLKIKQSSDVNIVATRLNRALEAMGSPLGEGINGQPKQFTATMGLSELQESDHGAVDAITRADVALSQAKSRAANGEARSKTVAEYIADSVAA
jgi:diguanylate cyclase (GGDEF)-like protein